MNGFPAGGIFWSCRRARQVDPFGVRRDLNLHVVHRKNFDGAGDVICRIKCRWRISDSGNAALLAYPNLQVGLDKRGDKPGEGNKDDGDLPNEITWT